MGRDDFRFFARQARNGFVGGQNCFFAVAVGFEWSGNIRSRDR
jgi:hypothetical protein